MWTVDDEIRDALAKLDKVQLADRDQTWQQQTDAVLQRAKEMIYKEQNILFPITAQHFTEEEWMQIYQDSRQYPDLFELEHKTWEKEKPSPGNRCRFSAKVWSGCPGGL